MTEVKPFVQSLVTVDVLVKTVDASKYGILFSGILCSCVCVCFDVCMCDVCHPLSSGHGYFLLCCYVFVRVQTSIVEWLVLQVVFSRQVSLYVL